MPVTYPLTAAQVAAARAEIKAAFHQARNDDLRAEAQMADMTPEEKSAKVDFPLQPQTELAATVLREMSEAEHSNHAIENLNTAIAFLLLHAKFEDPDMEAIALQFTRKLRD